MWPPQLDHFEFTVSFETKKFDIQLPPREIVVTDTAVLRVHYLRPS